MAIFDHHRRLYQRTIDLYEFRVATIDDVEGIVDLWPEHWAEANYHKRGIKPDEDRYRAWLEQVISYGLHHITLALRDREIVGFLAYSLDHNFSVRPVAVMGTFFVRKAHRRSAVPAILLDLAIADMKAEGACAFHAPISSESLASKALENTFKKCGFDTIGPIMGKAL